MSLDAYETFLFVGMCNVKARCEMMLIQNVMLN